MKLLLLLLASLTLASGTGVSMPQNGDVRLMNGSSLRGRVEVFNSSQGVWGTVCYTQATVEQNWERGAARAICRQLGWSDAVNVGSVMQLNILPAPMSTLTLLYELSCPYTTGITDLNNEFEHILRCDFTEDGSCSHLQDMAIECTGTSKYANPYDGEVRLVGGEIPSHGIVQVYLNDRWGTVCADNMTAKHADSVCRQMGYTIANSFSRVDVDSVNDSLPGVKSLEQVPAGPPPCFSILFSYPEPSDSFTCFNGSIAAVTCTFDLSGKVFTPGNEATCQVSPPIPWIHLAEYIGGAVGGVILLMIITLAIFCCCFYITGCPGHSWRERKLYGYDRVND